MYFRKRALIFLLSIAFVSGLNAQNQKLSGRVINEKNEPLAGVSVTLAEGGGTQTDIEGRFTLSLAPGKKYIIQFTAVGYAPKTINDAEVVTGEFNELNITLEVKAQTGDAVIVSAKASNARRETVSAVIAFQKNTNTVASVISAESIRRSPDKNTGEVLKRTPGASIQEGKIYCCSWFG